MSDIPIVLAVEDVLSEAVVREMLKQSERTFSIGLCLNKGGYGYLKRIVPGLNQAAQGMPYLLLTDLVVNVGWALPTVGKGGQCPPYNCLTRLVFKDLSQPDWVERAMKALLTFEPNYET